MALYVLGKFFPFGSRKRSVVIVVESLADFGKQFFLAFFHGL